MTFFPLGDLSVFARLFLCASERERAIKERVDVNVINANQKRVVVALRRRLREKYPFACACPQCFGDMEALALNYLPPHYCADAQKAGGAASPRLCVESAVADAIERVIKNPKHDT